MDHEPDKSPLIVIVGETASGKSALAMELAEKFNGEIIAADSWTVYKDFDIGTAKPTSEEQKKIPHHLLDIADPRVGFSAAEFKNLAFNAINDISKRGKLPIMVGGTGLYIDSVIYNYQFLPPGSPELRASLNELDLMELQARIKQANINSDGIDLRNRRRIIRLLETEGQRPAKHEIRENSLIIGLEISREELADRVERRIEEMLAVGLEREVRNLADTFGWGVEPMKGIGYREFWHYFQGEQTLSETRSQIIRSTMALAKKQHTWFKRNPDIKWVNNREETVELVTTFLDKS